MKKLILLLIAVTFGCKPTQQQTTPKIVSTIKNNISQKLDNCSKNGDCTFELIPNKSIIFKKDNFGIGYPILNEGNKTVLKYTFNKKTPPNTADANYSEIIYAELDANINEISLENLSLQQVKLYFGRLCYCKGSTGYFAIKKGKFNITKPTKNTINFSAKFEITEVPQIVKNFNTTVSIK
ncbi:hypothetical protein SAMN05444411_101305 [Lutibacter oricola]|uniref:Lipoprotein n=1 Tax=Lutibacter oricola TaxID=762486 RepID=A0A1H2RRQ6_9FLAO|nr:hypothetical protein [Lutibacter oricola]SDW22007.1 hypothetical protein SAMN05444411_101305 [Lutibacter oricola]